MPAPQEPTHAQLVCLAKNDRHTLSLLARFELEIIPHNPKSF
jgi:hypothetical protein